MHAEATRLWQPNSTSGKRGWLSAANDCVSGAEPFNPAPGHQLHEMMHGRRAHRSGMLAQVPGTAVRLTTAARPEVLELTLRACPPARPPAHFPLLASAANATERGRQGTREGGCAGGTGTRRGTRGKRRTAWRPLARAKGGGRRLPWAGCLGGAGAGPEGPPPGRAGCSCTPSCSSFRRRAEGLPARTRGRRARRRPRPLPAPSGAGERGCRLRRCHTRRCCADGAAWRRCPLRGGGRGRRPGLGLGGGCGCLGGGARGARVNRAARAADAARAVRTGHQPGHELLGGWGGPHLRSGQQCSRAAPAAVGRGGGEEGRGRVSTRRRGAAGAARAEWRGGRETLRCLAAAAAAAAAGSARTSMTVL